MFLDPNSGKEPGSSDGKGLDSGKKSKKQLNGGKKTNASASKAASTATWSVQSVPLGTFSL